MAFALLNRNKYPNIDHNNHPLLTSNPPDLVPFLENDLYISKDILPDLKSFSPPRLFCTHIPYALPKSFVKETRCEVVYLCRDPIDIFVSFWHFVNDLRPQSMGTLSLEEVFESFWKESLMERSNKVIMFLRYEEMKMKKNPKVLLMIY